MFYCPCYSAIRGLLPNVGPFAIRRPAILEAVFTLATPISAGIVDAFKRVVAGRLLAKYVKKSLK
jgi:hypothetical protein